MAGYRRAVSGEIAAALGSDAASAIVGSGPKFTPGDRVRLASMGVTGEIVRRLDSGKWEVRAGLMRLKALGADMTLAEEDADLARPPTEDEIVPRTFCGT